MSYINSSSLHSKFTSYVKENHNEILKASSAEAEKIANEAGGVLVRCINNAISSSGLSGGAIAAIGDVSSTSAVEAAPGKYEVEVSIGTQSRPSLAPVEYGGVRDMAALFNNGYSAGGRVFGYWHGSWIGSLTFRDGAHFVEIGVNDFNAGYGSQYNAVATITSDRFE